MTFIDFWNGTIYESLKSKRAGGVFRDFEYGLLHFYVLYILFPVVKDRKIKNHCANRCVKVDKMQKCKF